MPESKTITLSQSQFEKLRKIIYDRSGIHFPDSKKYVLESRLGRRLEELELGDYDQYVQFLSMGPYMDDEFQEMFVEDDTNGPTAWRTSEVSSDSPGWVRWNAVITSA